MADRYTHCALRLFKNCVFIQHKSGKGSRFRTRPWGQKGAACSEVPVFGREFNCISTCRQVKLAKQESVRLTQTANSCHPQPYGVTSLHANLLPELRLLLLLYVLRRRVFWRREARQLRNAI